MRLLLQYLVVGFWCRTMAQQKQDTTNHRQYQMNMYCYETKQKSIVMKPNKTTNKIQNIIHRFGIFSKLSNQKM